jgi:UPF0755 protein
MYKRKILVWISLMGTALGCYFVYNFYVTFFWNNTVFENDYSYIFIDRDDSIDSLELQLGPLLKSTSNFRLAAEKKGYSQNIKPGKYKILKGLGNNEMINLLRSKRQTVKVVFNNQERLENLAGRVSKQIEADSLSLLNAFYDTEFLSSNGFTQKNALSLYLPNSYDFFWDTTAEDFRSKMLSYYKLFWNDTRRAKAKALQLTPQEVYILASIVQKESPKKDEQARVAGAYVNRLKKRMKLQADPTVIFAVKKASGDFNQVIKRVLYKDLRLKSPYNTYRVKGLPPGPITMPDLSAIEAVLNPEKHSFLYFVADPTNPGYHLFAKNLLEHNRNKKIYINWINKKKIYR